MANFSVTAQAQGVFSLSGLLDRSSVATIWPERLAEIKQVAAQHAVVLDLQKLTHVDTAGLAWLINLIRDCAAQNTNFSLKNVPTTLLNLAKISDVEGFLPLQ